AVLRRGHGVALVLEHLDDGAQDVGVVLDDEHAAAGARGLRVARRVVRHACLPGGCDFSTGRTTVNVAPSPGALSTEIVPSWASTICLATHRPRPRPPKLRAETPRSKRPKMRRRYCGSMPTP